MNSSTIKYVFRPHPVSGRFCYQILDGSYVFLDEKFPSLFNLGRTKGDSIHIKKIHFAYHGSPGVAWIDKHGNAIIRYINPFKQSKINFKNV